MDVDGNPVIVAATIGIAVAILTESAVSFLGLGFPLELPTWGSLLNAAKDRIALNIWLVAGPGLLLSATVMSVNLVGDGLRDDRCVEFSALHACRNEEPSIRLFQLIEFPLDHTADGLGHLLFDLR